MTLQMSAGHVRHKLQQDFAYQERASPSFYGKPRTRSERPVEGCTAKDDLP